MGIDFKLIIGKLKLHLCSVNVFCLLSRLKAVCVTALTYEIKLKYKYLKTDFRDTVSALSLKHTSNLKCFGKSSYVSGACHYSVHGVKLNP